MSDFTSPRPFDLEELRNSVLKMIERVGDSKAVGYIPLDTLGKVPRFSELEFKNLCERRGLRFEIFSSNETCIRSGAAFFWSEEVLKKLIIEFCGPQSEAVSRLTTVEFVSKIAKRWYPPDHRLMPLVRRAFGDK